jgi:hypothetical protein
MTTSSTAVEHSSCRLVVVLPGTYGDVRSHYETLVPEVDSGRLSEMASRQATLDLAKSTPRTGSCGTPAWTSPH